MTYHAPNESSKIYYFQDNQKVGILGDWGTGLQDANDILEELVVNEGATIILHNGDVYYAGFPGEFDRISDKINQLHAKGYKFKYYAVPGNHDLYTFGGPFYESLKKNNSDQEIGVFCVRNKSGSVQFLGLNTGKNDSFIGNQINPLYEGTSIDEAQLKWAINRINEFKGKTILITHHPLFSTFEKTIGTWTNFGKSNPNVNPKLASQLFDVLPKITVWMWGHEHRFSTYKQNSFAVNRSVMIGNSAFQNNQTDYYKINFPSGDITIDTYHPQKGTSITDKGWYNHTAILLTNFVHDQNIKAKYIYMTSSYRKKSVRTKVMEDEYASPKHEPAQFRVKLYRILEQSGLSINTKTGRVKLDSQPSDYQLINAQS